MENGRRPSIFQERQYSTVRFDECKIAAYDTVENSKLYFLWEDFGSEVVAPTPRLQYGRGIDAIYGDAE